MPDELSAELFAQYMRIARLLAGQLDFQSAIDAVAKEIKSIVPHDHMDVCIITPGSTFHTAYESGLATDWSKRPPASIQQSPLRSLLVGEVDRLITADASIDPIFHFEGAFSTPILENKLRSRLHAALKVHGETIGALSFSSLTPGFYTTRHLDRACSIADLIAPYFYALRAVEEAKRSAIVEAETRVREEALRQGARRLTEALDAERQRIGMELHDQTLADMTRLSRRLEKLSLMSNLPGEMLEPLTRSLQESMHDLRQIIEQARPSVLQLFGLVEAIETQIERSVRDSGITFDWHLVDDTDGACNRLPQTVSLAIFRIAQEAINNAIRHSDGDRLDVHLTKDAHHLVLEIRDNGVGMKQKSGARGSGIENMRTRARLIAAQFSCGSDANGSYVRVRLAAPGEGERT